MSTESSKEQQTAEIRSTPEQEQHSDFAAGRYFVFDDSLGMDEEARHMVETSLDFLPERVTVIATDAYHGDGCLAAEKLVASNGRRFILVRPALREEEAMLYGGEEEDEDFNGKQRRLRGALPDAQRRGS